MRLLWCAMTPNTADIIAASAARQYLIADSHQLVIAAYEGEAELWRITPGGGQRDRANEAIVADNGDLIIVGSTHEPGWLTGGFDDELSGGPDGFVLRISPEGEVRWGTYLGREGLTEVSRVVIGPQGDLFVAGRTTHAWSGGTVFGDDGFIARIAADGSALRWVRYIGGRTADAATAVALDADGNSYITGYLSGDSVHLEGGFAPETFGGSRYQSSRGRVFTSHGDAFVASWAPDGTPRWATHLGTTHAEAGMAIRVHDGRLVVAGVTDEGQPGTHPWGERVGKQDAFLAEVALDGSAMLAVTTFGTPDFDEITDLLPGSPPIPVGYSYSPSWTASGPGLLFTNDALFTLPDIPIYRMTADEDGTIYALTRAPQPAGCSPDRP